MAGYPYVPNPMGWATPIGDAMRRYAEAVLAGNRYSGQMAMQRAELESANNLREAQMAHLYAQTDELSRKAKAPERALAFYEQSQGIPEVGPLTTDQQNAIRHFRSLMAYNELGGANSNTHNVADAMAAILQRADEETLQKGTVAPGPFALARFAIRGGPHTVGVEGNTIVNYGAGTVGQPTAIGNQMIKTEKAQEKHHLASAGSAGASARSSAASAALTADRMANPWKYMAPQQIEQNGQTVWAPGDPRGLPVGAKPKTEGETKMSAREADLIAGRIYRRLGVQFDRNGNIAEGSSIPLSPEDMSSLQSLAEQIYLEDKSLGFENAVELALDELGGVQEEKSAPWATLPLIGTLGGNDVTARKLGRSFVPGLEAKGKIGGRMARDAGGQEAAPPPAKSGVPDLNTFMDRARKDPKNKGIPDQQLRDFYIRKYGAT